MRPRRRGAKPVRAPADLRLATVKGPAPGDAERTERMARDLLREIGRLPRMPDS
jgi:hypothetical protein